MHTTVRAKDGTITIEVPSEWNGMELEVEIHPAGRKETFSEAMDRILDGRRLSLDNWKFDRDQCHER